MGKTTLARILAKCLNCETGHHRRSPAASAAPARRSTAAAFVDLIEIDAATNTGIDEMRALLDNAAYAPTRGRFKVYVIDEVHMLSKSAFNAMLKTLEEPPEHIKFILATTDPQKIPVTVLSRCLQFNLKQMPRRSDRRRTCSGILGAGKDRVRRRRAGAHRARRGGQHARRAVAARPGDRARRRATCRQRDVREMLGAVDETYLLRLLEALAGGDGAALAAIADDMQSRSLSFDVALQDLASLLLRLALAQTVPAALEEDLPERERSWRWRGASIPKRCSCTTRSRCTAARTCRSRRTSMRASS